MAKRIGAAVLVVALLVLQAAPVWAADAAGPLPDRGGPIVQAARSIGKVVVDIAIGLAAVLMAVGIATGFLSGQFLVTVGAPYGMSHAWIKVISVILLGIATFLTIVIVNTIIDTVIGLIPPTEIPSVMLLRLPRCG